MLREHIIQLHYLGKSTLEFFVGIFLYMYRGEKFSMQIYAYNFSLSSFSCQYFIFSETHNNLEMNDAVAKFNSVTILKTKRIEINYTSKTIALKHIAEQKI